MGNFVEQFTKIILDLFPKYGSACSDVLVASHIGGNAPNYKPNSERVAEQCGMPPSTANAALHRLKDQGLVQMRNGYYSPTDALLSLRQKKCLACPISVFGREDIDPAAKIIYAYLWNYEDHSTSGIKAVTGIPEKTSHRQIEKLEEKNLIMKVVEGGGRKRRQFILLHAWVNLTDFPTYDPIDGNPEKMIRRNFRPFVTELGGDEKLYESAVRAMLRYEQMEWDAEVKVGGRFVYKYETLWYARYIDYMTLSEIDMDLLKKWDEMEDPDGEMLSSLLLQAKYNWEHSPSGQCQIRKWAVSNQV